MMSLASMPGGVVRDASLSATHLKSDNLMYAYRSPVSIMPVSALCSG